MSVILPQIIPVKMTKPTMKYYSNKGYDVPSLGKTLNVNVTDLPPNSTYSVDFNCDGCGINFSRKWLYHNKRQAKKFNGKSYCKNCVNRGERSGTWNPNVTQEDREQKRNYPEYYEFVKRVLARDNFICQRCGVHNNDMEVHHLDGYNWCIEKRTDDTNGITLCHDCHDEFHCLYGKKDNTKEQFEEWINKEISLDVYSGEVHKMPKIYCIEDDIVYENVIEAGKAIGCYPYSVYDVCKGRTKSLFNKHYMFYYDYLNGNIPSNIYDYYQKAHMKFTPKSYIYNIPKHKIDLKKEPLITLCLNDGVIYDFSKSKETPYNIKYLSEIYRTCNGRRLHCGQLNGKYLDWCWLSDFQQLSPKEQLQIALDNAETLQEGSFLFYLLYNNKDIQSPPHQTPLQLSAQ